MQAAQLKKVGKLKDFFKALGPGVTTGAADDDPSGIATYSVVARNSEPRSCGLRG